MNIKMEGRSIHALISRLLFGDGFTYRHVQHSPVITDQTSTA